MDKFVIRGGKKLSGTVKVSGAKNVTLPIMTAALLAPGKTVLHNVPQINDVKMMAHLLRIIGARVDFEGDTLTIDATGCSYTEAPYELVSKMRASIYVLGPLLARLHQADVSFPGGCAIGTRPVDMHLAAMKTLGADIKIEHGYIIARAEKLTGADIVFEKISVGATANTLMAAVLADGITDIWNAALEPDIGALVDFLNLMGADIDGKDTNHLRVRGVKDLRPVETAIIPDRIEAGTLLIAGAITRSDITVENCVPDHIRGPIGKLREAGFHIEVEGSNIRVYPAGETIHPLRITTQPYPGFPTDLQAQYMALMTVADGTSVIEDTVFPNRFMHVAELNRMDADIQLDRNIAVINGIQHLSGSPVMATDLRASAALVLAGLAAEGKTEVSRIYHIDRGYENIDLKLQKLGADITRLKG